MIWGYETIRDFVATRVSEKLQNVPAENIQPPSLTVAGPVLEALKYTGHESELREMYANLLASALDVKTKELAHPSYVEVIKQLSPEEAKLLLILCRSENYPKLCSHNSFRQVKGGNFGINDGTLTSNQIAKEFSRFCKGVGFSLDVKSALDNFRRLQILDIEITSTQSIGGSRTSLDRARDFSETLQLNISQTETLFFTYYGQKFVKTCVLSKI